MFGHLVEASEKVVGWKVVGFGNVGVDCDFRFLVAFQEGLAAKSENVCVVIVCHLKVYLSLSA